MFIEPNFCTKHSSWSEQAVSFNKQRDNINCMHVILVAFDRVEILGGNLVCVCVCVCVCACVCVGSALGIDGS